MPFNLPPFTAGGNAEKGDANAPAWLNMAVGYFDKICTCSSSYSQDQVENEILDDECTIRNKAYWRTVEEALSAQDSEDGGDTNNGCTVTSNDQSPERRTTRISVDAFITNNDDQAPLDVPSIHESPCPSDSASPGTNVIEPLVLSPRSATPPITCGKPQFVMDMSSEFKSRNGKSRRMKKCRSMFLRTSRALDYHSLGSVESFERRSKLLTDADETSLASMSTAPTEFSSSQRSNVMDASRTSIVVRRNDNMPAHGAHVSRTESRLEAKLRNDSKKQTRRRPSAREMMDESVHSMPYLTMWQGYEV